MNVIIRTKKIAEYFSGKIKKGYFPMEGKELWYVACESYAGGSRKVSPLTILDYRETNSRLLMAKLKTFAKSYRYIIEVSRKRAEL